MPTVFDVASYILNQYGPMNTMKLQKLVYYSQAWSLVWDEKPIFSQPVEAWANGPVVRALYEAHRGRFEIGPNDIAGNPDALEGNQKETIDLVLGYYANKPTQWLVDLTHMEDPWSDARRGLPDTARSNNVITHAAMAEYYSSLQGQSDGVEKNWTH